MLIGCTDSLGLQWRWPTIRACVWSAALAVTSDAALENLVRGPSKTHIVPSANRASADNSICCQIKPGISTKDHGDPPGRTGAFIDPRLDMEIRPQITLDCQAGLTRGR